MNNEKVKQKLLSGIDRYVKNNNDISKCPRCNSNLKMSEVDLSNISDDSFDPLYWGIVNLRTFCHKCNKDVQLSYIIFPATSEVLGDESEYESDALCN